MTQPVLRVISGNATPDEVAAIVAALASIEADRRIAADPSGATAGSLGSPSAWVEVSRRTARAVPSARGSWRLAARVPRRLR